MRLVGKELGVRYILEGSVRAAGDQLRINAQLIEAEIGLHLWALMTGPLVLIAALSRGYGSPKMLRWAEYMGNVGLTRLADQIGGAGPGRFK